MELPEWGVSTLLFGPNWNETVDFKMSIGYKKASTEMEEDYLMGISGGFE